MTAAAAGPRPRPRVRGLVSRYGVLAAIVLTFVVFSVLRPDSFLSGVTLLGILRDCVPLLLLAMGVSVVMVMNQFDLSVGGLTSLLAVVSVLLVSTTYYGLPWWVAVVVTVLLGALLGLAVGVGVAYLRLPAFILTIAVSTVFAGWGLQLTSSRSIFEGVPEAYTAIARGSLLGLSHQVWIGAAAVVVLHVFLSHTEPGRYMYAIGGNAEAARLSGVRVRLLVACGFAVVGVTAGLAGVLLTSQAGASNPSTGLGLLLPAYAAAFLGSSLFRIGVFTPVGTAIGAVYLQTIAAGLTLLNLSGPLVSIIQGAILVGAIGVARLARDTR